MTPIVFVFDRPIFPCVCLSSSQLLDKRGAKFTYVTLLHMRIIENYLQRWNLVKGTVIASCLPPEVFEVKRREGDPKTT